MKLESICIYPFNFKEGAHGQATFSDDGCDIKIKLDDHQCRKIIAFCMDAVTSKTKQAAKVAAVNVEIAMQTVIAGELEMKDISSSI